ncbi:ABC transporter permease [Sphaerisporangium sp. NPDC088356]|uniref:ABC transporter permease n=1 Tax=Sphaerisporangium sp. NPDC088356 TaxID=3154871 RepID=UPI00343352F3
MTTPYPLAKITKRRMWQGKVTAGARRVARDLWSTPSGRAAIAIIGVFLLTALLAPVIAPHGPLERVRAADGGLARLLPPGLAHPFGTTNFGRDIFDQVVWGTRRTLSVAGMAALATALIGLNVGLIAGYLGGKVDSVLMRIADTAYAIPFLPLAIVLVGILGRSDFVLVLAIAVLFWRTTARVVRAQVLSLKERAFVKAAVVGGASRRRVLYVHIAPNVASLAILYGMLLVAEAVLAEAGLSFLGMAPTNAVSWGTIMFDAFSSQEMNRAWWWPLFPGLAIMLFVFAVSLLGRAHESLQRRHLEVQS